LSCAVEFAAGQSAMRPRHPSHLRKTRLKKVDDRSVRSRPFEPRRIWCRLARRADHAVVHEGPQLHQGKSVVSSWLLLFRQCRRFTPSPPLTAVSILLRPSQRYGRDLARPAAKRTGRAVVSLTPAANSWRTPPLHPRASPRSRA
jgi:hypothetical protein